MKVRCQICNEEHEANVMSRIEKVKCPRREYNISITSYECNGKEWMAANVLPNEGETLQEAAKAYLRDFGDLLKEMAE